ncbi:hypothetical protein DEU56DRAFT_762439 [Suillus clintonianus]|uniref:uncharacterized protein n=1 Tax=Suillus clintonianus TaxID=1904413 RepID=UPI001B85C609|nr:uncharacterized protein DEU56DRAFT_762439 [Suillus clintonianus]KAG2109508.1 hypothetical protein DEU56DRAFT_762439 [Suillus clintonianus]
MKVYMLVVSSRRARGLTEPSKNRISAGLTLNAKCEHRAVVGLQLEYARGCRQEIIYVGVLSDVLALEVMADREDRIMLVSSPRMVQSTISDTIQGRSRIISRLQVLVSLLVPKPDLGNSENQVSVGWVALDVMTNGKEGIKFVPSTRMHAMSSETPPTRGVRTAKKNALKNAVWLPEKTCTKRQQRDTPSSQRDTQCEPQWGSQLQSKPKSTKKRKKQEDEVTTKRRSPDTPSAQDEPQWGSQPRSQSKPKSTKKRYSSDDEDEAVKRKQSRLDAKKSSGHTARQLTSIKEDQLEQSGSEEEGDHTDNDQTDVASDAEESDDSDFEDPTSITKMLSTEIPSFVSSSKAKNPPAARDRKRAAETPVWANDLMISESESCDDSAPKSDGDTSTFISASTSYQSIGRSEASTGSMAKIRAKPKQHLMKADIVKAKSEQDFSDAEDKLDTSSTVGSRSSSHPSGSSSAKLILTEHGKVKMMDQDVTTRKVIQGAILEAKAHMTFVNGYPELIEKTSFSRDTLLKAARDHGATSIELKLKTW